MKKPVRGIDDNTILTAHQKKVLKQFSLSDMRDVFRLTGGTALSAFYLEHRLSEDLDFFSSQKIPLYSIERFLKALNGVDEIVQTKLFDRQLFNLKLSDKTVLKLEFTFFPLVNIEAAASVENVAVDGLLDIVVNKLCAIADRLDAKDYVDVYVAMKQAGFSLDELIKLAEQKCEIKGIGHVLKSRLLQVPEGLDRLPLKVAVTREEVESFFARHIRMMVKKEIL